MTQAMNKTLAAAQEFGWITRVMDDDCILFSKGTPTRDQVQDTSAFYIQVVVELPKCTFHSATAGIETADNVLWDPTEIKGWPAVRKMLEAGSPLVTEEVSN